MLRGHEGPPLVIGDTMYAFDSDGRTRQHSSRQLSPSGRLSLHLVAGRSGLHHPTATMTEGASQRPAPTVRLPRWFVQLPAAAMTVMVAPPTAIMSLLHKAVVAALQRVKQAYARSSVRR